MKNRDKQLKMKIRRMNVIRKEGWAVDEEWASHLQIKVEENPSPYWNHLKIKERWEAFWVEALLSLPWQPLKCSFSLSLSFPLSLSLCLSCALSVLLLLLLALFDRDKRLNRSANLGEFGPFGPLTSSEPPFGSAGWKSEITISLSLSSAPPKWNSLHDYWMRYYFDSTDSPRLFSRYDLISFSDVVDVLESSCDSKRSDPDGNRNKRMKHLENDRTLLAKIGKSNQIRCDWEWKLRIEFLDSRPVESAEILILFRGWSCLLSVFEHTRGFSGIMCEML